MPGIINYTTKCKLKKIVKSSAISKLRKSYPNAHVGVNPVNNHFSVKTPDGAVIFEIRMGGYDRYFEMDIDLVDPSNLVTQIYTFLLLGCPVSVNNKISSTDVSPREMVVQVARKFDKVGHKVNKGIMKKSFAIFFSSK